MGLIDAFWHLLNLAGAAFGVALFASLGAKLLWRRPLAQVAWWRLVLRTFVAGLVVSILGLVWARDGHLVTYAALVTVSALALWWQGVRHTG